MTAPDITRRQFLAGSAALAAASRLHAASSSDDPRICTGLRCEYAENPLGIDVVRPRLSWNMVSGNRGARQTAYQVLVTSSREKLAANHGDLWDSGRVASAASSQIVYTGAALQSRQRCWWKIRVWDENHHPGEWSHPAHWEMALLHPPDWRAKWIAADAFDPGDVTATAPAPFFRKEFAVSKAVTSARVYICGLGFYELYLNGNKIGDQVLSPNQTNYDRRTLGRLLYPFDDKTGKRVLYLTHDVTANVVAGNNTIGAILGNGWYNQRDRLVEGDMWYGTPRLIAQLEITYADGTRQEIVTDATWSVTDTGPILHDGIFSGERYDARLEMHGWAAPGFNASAWRTAVEVPAPAGRLLAQAGFPDRVIQTLQPVSYSRTGPQTTRFDFGQNLAGWARLHAYGVAGSDALLQFTEEGGRGYGQQDNYILRGGDGETYEPRFTWHGFRYVDVVGTEELRKQLRVEARVVGSDIQPAGDFHCSNPLFNRILQNYRWSQRSNVHCGVPSDCPHRERVGYTGDGQTSAEAAILNFDMARFYTKWIDDIADAQNRNSQNGGTGYVPHSAPFEGGAGGPAWGSAYAILPWLMYLYYGDRRVLEENYSGMKRWVEYLRTRTDKDGIVVREEPGDWDLGEWATPGTVEIPPEMVNTCYYAYCAQLVAQTAGVLGNTAEVSCFQNIASAAATALNQRYFDANRAQYWEGRQGANVFPLAFGLVPAKHRKAVFNRLVEITVRQNNTHFDTGMLGTRLLLRILSDGGRADLAYELMNQQTQPGFGWQIAQGATTLWENWNGEGSHNHVMFGGVCEWFYQSLAGIRPDPANPGFRHVFIQPEWIADLSHVEARYRSAQGEIRSGWNRTDKDIQLQLTIPANCEATVLLPDNDASKIRESGQRLDRARGVRILNPQNGRMALRIESGSYDFLIAKQA